MGGHDVSPLYYIADGLASLFGRCQVRLNGVATGIGQAGLAVASLVLVILIVRYAVGFQPKPTSQIVKEVVDIFSIAVSPPALLPLASMLAVGAIT